MGGGWGVGGERGGGRVGAWAVVLRGARGPGGAGRGEGLEGGGGAGEGWLGGGG